MFLPPKSLEKLKCSLCNRLLSVFPIYINKKDQQSSVCGRCQLPDNDNYVRCEIYENIATNVHFPCINKESGCMHNLLPKDVEKHEKICLYRNELCILAQQTNCDWKGPFNQLFVHYKDKHEELLLKNNQFEFDVSKNHHFTNILLYSDVIFLFQCNFNHKLKQLKCSILILTLDSRFRVKFYTQIILTTKDTTITKKFPQMDSNQQQPKSIDLNIENALSKDDTKVSVKILIVDEKEKFVYNTESNQNLLENMKCFKCKEIIIGEVFNCKNTHYTCENCSSSCCSKSENDKALLKFFNLVYKKCSYCNFINKDLSSHSCFYTPIDCVLDKLCCKWQGAIIDFGKHLQNDHRETILKLNEIVRLDIDTSTERYMFYHNVYKLTVTNNFPELLFTMESILKFQWIKDFRFEISVLDSNDIERIRIRLPDDSYGGFNYQLQQNQIKDIIFENTLFFRLNILNI